MNKYTLVPVDDDVLNGSSNDDDDDSFKPGAGRPKTVYSAVDLNSHFELTTDDVQKQRNFWDEIEYLASTKDQQQHDDKITNETSKTPHFIFPFVYPNFSGSKTADNKRDYFGFDDDDFTFEDNDRTFPSIDSSSSDDDDVKYSYRPGRYRMDTIPEENEEDPDDSSARDDETDTDQIEATIFNSSFAASNESENSSSLINVDRKLSLELLRERKKKLQERHVRRISEDSSTDEELAGNGKSYLQGNSFSRRRLKTRRLLDTVPISAAVQVRPKSELQKRENSIVPVDFVISGKQMNSNNAASKNGYQAEPNRTSSGLHSNLKSPPGGSAIDHVTESFAEKLDKSSKPTRDHVHSTSPTTTNTCNVPPNNSNNNIVSTASTTHCNNISSSNNKHAVKLSVHERNTSENNPEHDISSNLCVKNRLKPSECSKDSQSANKSSSANKNSSSDTIPQGGLKRNQHGKAATATSATYASIIETNPTIKIDIFRANCNGDLNKPSPKSNNSSNKSDLDHTNRVKTHDTKSHNKVAEKPLKFTNLKEETGELINTKFINPDSCIEATELLQSSRFLMDANNYNQSNPSTMTERRFGLSRAPLTIFKPAVSPAPTNMASKSQTTQTSLLTSLPFVVKAEFCPTVSPETNNAGTQTQLAMPNFKHAQSNVESYKTIFHRETFKKPPVVSVPIKPMYVVEIPIDQPAKRSNSKASTGSRSDLKSQYSEESRIENIKLKAPPSYVDGQWNALVHTVKHRDIKVVPTSSKPSYILKFQESSAQTKSTSKAFSSSSSRSTVETISEKSRFNRPSIMSTYYTPGANHHSKSDHPPSRVTFIDRPTTHPPKYSFGCGRSSHRPQSHTAKSIPTRDSYREASSAKSAVDLTRLGCPESSLRSMSESELRVWISLQQLDIPEWYLNYPDKNKEIAGLKNTRSVNDIMADIEKLSLPGEQRILGDLNLTKSVPSLVLMHEQQKEAAKKVIGASKRWSTNLASSYHTPNENDASNSHASLPQYYRSLRWSVNFQDLDQIIPQNETSHKTHKTVSFTLPSDTLRHKAKEPPFKAVAMPAFEDIMQGVKLSKVEDKNEVITEKLVKQIIPPDLDVSFDSPQVVRIRRIRDPDEVQREKERKRQLSRKETDDENNTSEGIKSNSVSETHFPVDCSNAGEDSKAPINDGSSTRGSKDFVNGDFPGDRKALSFHDERPLRLSEEHKRKYSTQQFDQSSSKNPPDDSGFVSDLTPSVNNKIGHQDKENSSSGKDNSKPKKGSRFNNLFGTKASSTSLSKHHQRDTQTSSLSKDRPKSGNFSFGFFRSSKKTSSSRKTHSAQENTINKLNHELQRGSFAPFIEHRV